MTTSQLLPHDVDAEEAVLGSLLIDPEAVAVARAVVQPADFYRERNVWIYGACLALGETINQVTVAHRLSQDGRLEDIGGPAYLSYLVARVPTPFHVEYYAEIVRDMAIKRRLIDVGAQIAGFGYNGMLPTEGIARSRDLLDKLVSQGQEMRFRHIWEAMHEGEDETVHVTTGLKRLDRATLGGLAKGTLTILAGETTVGKSALSHGICLAAAKAGYSVGIVTLEMSEKQVSRRLLYSEARVDSYNLHLGDDEKLAESRGSLSGLGIWLCDPLARSFDEVKARLIAHNLREGLDLVLYDYIGLESGVRAESEAMRRSAVTRELRAMAKQLDAAVLAISPLSRDSHGGKSKMGRLAWTSELEYTPDAVLFLEEKQEQGKRNLYLEIAKQRMGLGRVRIPLWFDRSTHRIGEVEGK